MNGMILGSFDPITNGHLSLIQRAAKLVDHLYVALAINSEKTCFFSKEQRLAWLQKALGQIENVEVISWSGLAAEAARTYKCQVMIKGLRDENDFLYEKNIASVNHYINPEIETISLFCQEDQAWISSSAVREMLAYQVDVESLVPAVVYRDLKWKFYDKDDI